MPTIRQLGAAHADLGLPSSAHAKLSEVTGSDFVAFGGGGGGGGHGRNRVDGVVIGGGCLCHHFLLVLLIISMSVVLILQFCCSIGFPS